MTRWLKLKQLGKFKLLLNIGSYLDINEIFIILSFRPNLIFVPTLDLISVPTLEKSNFSFLFGNRTFTLFHDSKLVSSDYSWGYNDIYFIGKISSIHESLQPKTLSIKKKLTNETCHRQSSLLFIFIDFDFCVGYMKENKPIKSDLNPVELQMSLSSYMWIFLGLSL